MTSESPFSQELRKRLEKRGAWTFKVHGHAFQKTGVPDTLVISPLWSGFIEEKYDNRKVDPHQNIQMEKIEARGFPCFVIRYRSQLEKVFIENRQEELLSTMDWGTLTGENFLVTLRFLSLRLADKVATPEQIGEFAIRSGVAIPAGYL